MPYFLEFPSVRIPESGSRHTVITSTHSRGWGICMRPPQSLGMVPSPGQLKLQTPSELVGVTWCFFGTPSGPASRGISPPLEGAAMTSRVSVFLRVLLRRLCKSSSPKFLMLIVNTSL